jgi:hypothetical protein
VIIFAAEAARQACDTGLAADDAGADDWVLELELELAVGLEAVHPTRLIDVKSNTPNRAVHANRSRIISLRFLKLTRTRLAELACEHDVQTRDTNGLNALIQPLRSVTSRTGEFPPYETAPSGSGLAQEAVSVKVVKGRLPSRESHPSEAVSAGVASFNATGTDSGDSTPLDYATGKPTHSFMLDAIAAQGAIILPYGYRGVTVTRSSFTLNEYSKCNSSPSGGAPGVSLDLGTLSVSGPDPCVIDLGHDGDRQTIDSDVGALQEPAHPPRPKPTSMAPPMAPGSSSTRSGPWARRR